MTNKELVELLREEADCVCSRQYAKKYPDAVLAKRANKLRTAADEIDKGEFCQCTITPSTDCCINCSKPIIPQPKKQKKIVWDERLEGAVGTIVELKRVVKLLANAHNQHLEEDKG